MMFNDCVPLKVIRLFIAENVCVFHQDRLNTLSPSLSPGIRRSNFPCKNLFYRVSFLLFREDLAGSIKLVSDLAFILSTIFSDIPSAMPRTVALGMFRASSLKFVTIMLAQL